MKLNYWDDAWPYDPERPGDLYFTQFLRDRSLSGKVIFHFGTGVHHLVGRDNHEHGNPNEIMGITVSKGEYDAYIDFIIDNPIAANYYKVLFADIYTLSDRIIPAFDIVTLFHLGESYDDFGYSPKLGLGKPEQDKSRLNSAYARLDDLGVLRLFVSKLNPGGLIVFSIEPKGGYLANDFVAQGNLTIIENYKTLVVCQPAARVANAAHDPKKVNN
jgi:hypothetical protein